MIQTTPVTMQTPATSYTQQSQPCVSQRTIGCWLSLRRAAAAAAAVAAAAVPGTTDIEARRRCALLAAAWLDRGGTATTPVVPSLRTPWTTFVVIARCLTMPPWPPAAATWWTADVARAAGVTDPDLMPGGRLPARARSDGGGILPERSRPCNVTKTRAIIAVRFARLTAHRRAMRKAALNSGARVGTIMARCPS